MESTVLTAPGVSPEDALQKRKELFKSLNAAKVVGTPAKQNGREHVRAHCPKCGMLFGLSAFGGHICQQCHTPIEVVEKL